MQPEEGKKYIITKDKFAEILKNINEFSDEKAQEIMYNNMMHRTIFKHNDAKNTENQSSWIRIRVGDISCDGTSQCTVTYKNKKHKVDKTNSSLFSAEDYYSVVQFFRDIGMPLVSEQETLRSKYIFYYENVKYIICFDTWPHLSEIIFITISAANNITEDQFRFVCETLKLPQIAVQVGYVDIDKAYEENYGKKASEIRQLRFNMPLNSDRVCLKNVLGIKK